jgi:PPM family protein phosphatase
MSLHGVSKLVYAGGSDKGKVRERNEDSFLCCGFDNSDVSLLIVADGVGGYAGGAEASQLAVETMRISVEKALLQAHSGGGYAEQWLELTLEQAIVDANLAIIHQQNTQAEYQHMATTVVAILIKANEMVLSHLGDSRCYQYADQKLMQLTADHTYLQDMLNAGKISQHEFESLPMHNVISQALGLKVEPVIKIEHLLVEENIMFLLCTDGLTNCVSDEQIKFLLKTVEPIDACIDELIASANDNGGVDNISAVLVTRNV